MWNICYLHSPGRAFAIYHTGINKFIIVNMVQLTMSGYALVQYMQLICVVIFYKQLQQKAFHNVNDDNLGL
jgi:hypothetical protein